MIETYVFTYKIPDNFTEESILLKEAILKR